MKGEVNGIYRAEIPVVPTVSIQPQGKAVTTWARLKQATHKRETQLIVLPPNLWHNRLGFSLHYCYHWREGKSVSNRCVTELLTVGAMCN